MFVLWSLGFWILVGVLSVIVLIAVEAEKASMATVALVAAFFALAWWGDFNIVKAAIADPKILALIAVGYLAVGTLYGIIRWRWFVKRNRRRYDRAKRRFLSRMDIQGMEIPDKMKSDWESHCKYRSRTEGFSIQAPEARQYRSTILIWMMYWPWSFAWSVINEPIRRMFTHIYRSISGLLQRISDDAYKGTERDFRMPPPVDLDRAEGKPGTSTMPPAGGGAKDDFRRPFPADLDRAEGKPGTSTMPPAGGGYPPPPPATDEPTRNPAVYRLDEDD